MLERGEGDGFLIDLHLTPNQTGKRLSEHQARQAPKVSMAIGTLSRSNFHELSDLESFFWVLFLSCVDWNGPGHFRSTTNYESWNYKVTKKHADTKTGKLQQEIWFYEEVMSNFTACCWSLIPCMQELRKVIFPGGMSWLMEDRQLYIKIKTALEQARKNSDTKEKEVVLQVYRCSLHLSFDCSFLLYPLIKHIFVLISKLDRQNSIVGKTITEFFSAQQTKYALVRPRKVVEHNLQIATISNVHTLGPGVRRLTFYHLAYYVD